MLGLVMKTSHTTQVLVVTAFVAVLICLLDSILSKRTISKSTENGIFAYQLPDADLGLDVGIWKLAMDNSAVDADSGLAVAVKKWLGMMENEGAFLSDDPVATVAEKNTAANELFSLPELPDGIVSDLTRMFASTDEDEVWRDYCLQFLGSALEREDGVTDEDRALARETLVGALASTNATFAGTALRALHRGDPSDPLVASNALRIARDPSYPSSSRTAALLILEDCVRATPPTASTPSTASTLTETASAISSDPAASSLLRRTAEAVLKRNTD